MPIVSTPASPTPYAGEGEELMLVLRDFISASLSFTKNPDNPDHSGVFIERNSDKALRLLKQMPVARDAVFEYFALVIGQLVSQELGKASNRVSQSHVSSVEKLHKTLMEFIKHSSLGKAWSPIIVKWTLKVLGDLSAKAGRSKSQLNEDLSSWMATISGNRLCDLTAECMTRLNEKQTEDCISQLLDASVAHGSKFDWVVAHIGSCFPDVVITRVLSVGLKSQDEMAKINSVVGILNHLGATHKAEIQTCVLNILQDSEDPLVIPFLLNLSSLSDLMASTVVTVAAEVMNEKTAQKIAGLVPIWESKGVMDTKEEHFVKLTVNLLMKHGRFSLVQQLLYYSSEESPSEIQSGSRYILDHLSVELHNFVHTIGYSKKEGNGLIKEASLQWNSLMEQFLFQGDTYQKKIVSMLFNCVFLQEGRMLTSLALQKGLCRACNDEELSSVLLLIKDVEMWMPEVVALAIQLSFRAAPKDTFLANLGKILHYQNEANSGDMIETDVFPIVKDYHQELINLCSQPLLIPAVLKILNFVPLPEEQIIPANLLLKSCNNLVQALFITLCQDKDEQHLAQIVENLQVLANSTIGLPMVLRSLLTGAMSSSINHIFGGFSTVETKNDVVDKDISLYDENLKFGAMPTHPLGTSTVFHAGIIGQGKRKAPPTANETPETKQNCLTLITILFKICNEVTVINPDETYKNLACMVVELVVPDVMYNGLPWPEEDFTRVTIERDLQIVKTLDQNPFIWKLLWGLAELRPALCYCSVILRGALSVQMAHWASTLKASPKLVSSTRIILELMSIGQFLPHPLDSVSDVIQHFHPFQVHCILVDLWNYVKDNIPSPLAFVSNGKGSCLRKFGPYEEYKSYCQRLRLIMIQHLGKVAEKYQEFFVDEELNAIVLD